MDDDNEMGLKNKYGVYGMDPTDSGQGSDETLNGWVKKIESRVKSTMDLRFL